MFVIKAEMDSASELQGLSPDQQFSMVKARLECIDIEKKLQEGDF